MALETALSARELGQLARALSEKHEHPSWNPQYLCKRQAWPDVPVTPGLG